jgi:hypothetical protein
MSSSNLFDFRPTEVLKRKFFSCTWHFKIAICRCISSITVWSTTWCFNFAELTYLKLKTTLLWHAAPCSLLEIDASKFLTVFIRATHRPDDEDGRYLWTGSQFVPECMARLARRHFSSHSSPWEPENSMELQIYGHVSIEMKPVI